MLARILGFLVNFLAASSGITSLVWLHRIGGLRSNSVYMYTIWTVFAQIISSSVFLLSDVQSLLLSKVDAQTEKGSKSKTSASAAKIGVIKYLLFHISLVMTTATALMFWIIHSIDPHALVPKEFFYPDLMNHMHHTFPFLFSVALMFLYAKNEINTFKLKMDLKQANELGMSCVFCVNSCYSNLIVISSVVKGKWPYPFLNNLTKLQLGILIVSGNVIGLMISNIFNQILFKIARSMRVENIAKKTK